MSSFVARRLVLPLAAVALAAGAVVLAQPAGAAPAAAGAPVPTVTGVATAPVGTSPDVTITYTITVTGDPIIDAILVATQPATLPADPTSVQIDGAAAPLGAAYVAGEQLTIGVGEGAGPAGGGTLAAGKHTVSFTADASAAVNGAVDSAALTYGTAPVLEVTGAAEPAAVLPAAVTSGPVPVPLPDIVVTTPPGSGEDQTLPLGTGSDGVFAVLVRNTGAPVTAATLTVTLPAGLTVDEDFGVTRGADGDEDLTCSDASAHTVTCMLGAVTGLQQLILIPVLATPDAVVGTVGTFTVSALADSGVDGNRANNAVSGSVRYAGVANISLTLSPASRHVAVGDSTTVAVTVRNAGPQPAAGTVAILGVTTREGDPSSSIFRITHFSGRQIDLGDLGGLDGSGSGSSGSGPFPVKRSTALQQAYSHGSAVTTARRTSRTAAQPLPLIAWDVETVAPGKSVSATLTLKAVHVGSAIVVGFAIASNSDPSCTPDPTSDCSPLDHVQIDAVAAHAPAGSSSSPIAGGVADTGAPTGQLTLLGLLALLVGTVLLRAGVVRHRGRHRAI